MYIKREIRAKFEKITNIYPVVALVGARQSGKTTFLKELIKDSNSSYLLFDDPDIRDLFESDIKKFEEEHIQGYKNTVLDEVQYCNDAGKNLKYLAEKGRKVWITSSSEIILGKQVLSYLVGRVSIIKLFPFSINEFFSAKGKKYHTKRMLKRGLSEHISFGGYPKVVTTDDFELKKTILRDLYDTMILKDIAKTFSIKDLISLENFSRYLSLNIGGILSYDSISNSIKISFQTVKKYLDAMEKSYLIYRVPPFFSNKMKEITKQPKIYFIDTGLRNVISKDFETEPEGKLFENYLFSELMKMGFSPKYWRTKAKAEVDFIIEIGKEIIPIEVKISVRPDRLERSMKSFIETYKPKRAFIVSYKGQMGEMKFKQCKVIFTDVLGLREQLKNK